MVLISPEVELIDNSDYIRTMVMAGRLTHGCEDKFVSREDDLEYIERMKKLGHGRVFEHGTVWLIIPKGEREAELEFLEHNRYSSVFEYLMFENNGAKTYYYVTTNYRVLLQGWYDTWNMAFNHGYNKNLLYLIDDYKSDFVEHMHMPRPCVLWKNISRVTADSFRTHTMISSIMQSTRYCNYGKGRFGSDVKISRSVMWCAPDGLEDAHYDMSDVLDADVSDNYRNYLAGVCCSADTYVALVGNSKEPVRAEIARGVLPLDTATMFMQTAFITDWEDFLRQRLDKTAHPDARYISEKMDVFMRPKINKFKEDRKICVYAKSNV